MGFFDSLASLNPFNAGFSFLTTLAYIMAFIIVLVILLIFIGVKANYCVYPGIPRLIEGNPLRGTAGYEINMQGHSINL